MYCVSKCVISFLVQIKTVSENFEIAYTDDLGETGSFFRFPVYMGEGYSWISAVSARWKISRFTPLRQWHFLIPTDLQIHFPVVLFNGKAGG